jgi:hypothetical protein
MKTGNIWDDFEWRVASDYFWRETPKGLVLSTPKAVKTVSTYRPLGRESARLFQKFAELEPTPDAVLSFARRYGRLGYPVACTVEGVRVDPNDIAPSGIAARGFAALGGESILVEPFDFDLSPEPRLESVPCSWTSQIALMADFMRWLKGGSPRPSGDQRLAQDAVEEVHTTTRALRVNSVLAATVAPRIAPIGGKRAFRFRFEPRSLIGAIWLQAAQSAAEGVAFRHCASCNRPIAIARTTGARADAKFCSDACKSRSYRERQGRAIELAGRGWTPSRIAKELHTKPSVVRRWIKVN